MAWYPTNTAHTLSPLFAGYDPVLALPPRAALTKPLQMLGCFAPVAHEASHPFPLLQAALREERREAFHDLVRGSTSGLPNEHCAPVMKLVLGLRAQATSQAGDAVGDGHETRKDLEIAVREADVETVGVSVVIDVALGIEPRSGPFEGVHQRSLSRGSDTP